MNETIFESVSSKSGQTGDDLFGGIYENKTIFILILAATFLTDIAHVILSLGIIWDQCYKTFFILNL